jgi:hypothetical protein
MAWSRWVASASSIGSGPWVNTASAVDREQLAPLPGLTGGCVFRVELADPANDQSGEQPAHPAVAQKVHVVDRVRADEHPGDQGDDLAAGFAPPIGGDREPFGEQPTQTAALYQCHDRHQPGALHEVWIVEPGRDRVASVR